MIRPIKNHINTEVLNFTVDSKSSSLKNTAFKIYQNDFTCDVCGELSFMGIVGYSEEIKKICDLCLVNEIDQDTPESKKSKK